MLLLLVAALSLGGAAYLARLLVASARAGRPGVPVEGVALGAVTNFFDTLGIGSFAPTMSWLRFRRLVPDRLIPMTMVAGYITPSILQAVIFLVLLGVGVDPVLLVGCIVAMVLGGFMGVPIAARCPVRAVQLVVALALLMAAFFYALANLGLMPAGGSATSLPPGGMAVAIAAHLVFGILLSFGVGNYGPTLALLSLMGMDPRLAFPIMASAASFAGMTAGFRMVTVPGLDLRLARSMMIGAVPAVLVAAFLVKEMPLDWLRWLVVVVVTYAGLSLLAEAMKRRPLPPEQRLQEALLD